MNRDMWIGWSFFNDNIRSVSRETSLGTVIGQWKLDGEQPAIFRIIQTAMGEGNWATCNPAVCNRAGAATDDVVVQLDEIRQSANWGDAQNNKNVSCAQPGVILVSWQQMENSLRPWWLSSRKSYCRPVSM